MVLVNGLNRGELELRCKRASGVRAYVLDLTPWPVTAGSQWLSVSSTSARHLFTGLESGVEYAGRIGAVGVKGQLVYSEIVSKIAL